MREKKVRGLKRKAINMSQRIIEHTSSFPTDFSNGYWHFPLPVAQAFIDSNKTPRKIKRFCIQVLLDRAVRLLHMKPNDEEKYRVVVAVGLPSLWSSQIIVFQGDAHFENFFNRNDEYQKWIRLADDRSIQREWGLSIANDLQIVGYKEIITEEELPDYEGEIWFIGELN